MTDSALTRRRPACGSELEHGPHEYAQDFWPDGTVLGERERPGHCAGWTATEADLCVMIREVQRTMLEKSPPDKSRAFRVEIGARVMGGLLGLFLPADPSERLVRLFGAELMIVSGDPGGWRLVEALPPVASGAIRV